MRKKVETMADFICLGFKITEMVTAAIKVKEFLGGKAMTNLNSVLESRDFTLPKKYI